MVRGEPQAGVHDEKPVVYLHVGTPKSGTTYLQAILARNRDVLREAGCLYPGAADDAHFLAALDQLGINFRGHRDPRTENAWGAVVQEAREWTGTVVISHEIFCSAPREKAEAALRDLDFADVHLILTARDLARQIPAFWQEDLKNRYLMGFGDYVDAVRDRADVEQANGFWRMQDPASILRRWAADLPPERVHIVTMPRPGAPPSLLWERFADVTGIDPELCDLPSERANSGLGTVEAALLRRINENIDRGAVGWPAYEAFVKFGLAERGLVGRKGRAPVRLPVSDYDWVAEWSREMVRELTERRFAVTGDLAELLPEKPEEMRWHPDDVGIEPMFEASLDSIAYLVGELGGQRNRLRKRTAELEDRTAEVRERTAELKALEEVRARLEETERRLDETHKAMIAAYERPVWRQLAHRVAHWFPPLRFALRFFVRYRRERSDVTPK